MYNKLFIESIGMKILFDSDKITSFFKPQIHFRRVNRRERPLSAPKISSKHLKPLSKKQAESHKNRMNNFRNLQLISWGKTCCHRLISIYDPWPAIIPQLHGTAYVPVILFKSGFLNITIPPLRFQTISKNQHEHTKQHKFC